MYFQMQRIRRASARDDLNELDESDHFARDGATTIGARGGAYTALPEQALRERAGSSVLGKRRPECAPEPTSPTTPGITAFARNWAAAARKRQHVATLRLHRATTRAPPTPPPPTPFDRGTAAAAAPPPPAIDSPSALSRSLSPMQTRFTELTIAA